MTHTQNPFPFCNCCSLFLLPWRLQVLVLAQDSTGWGNISTVPKRKGRGLDKRDRHRCTKNQWDSIDCHDRQEFLHLSNSTIVISVTVYKHNKEKSSLFLWPSLRLFLLNILCVWKCLYLSLRCQIPVALYEEFCSAW